MIPEARTAEIPSGRTPIGALQALRLWRWVGCRTAAEPLLLVLHVGYGFVPLGLLCVRLSELGVLSPP